MATQNMIPYPKFHAFIAGTGNPLVGGQLYTLIPGGSLLQLKATYTDATGNAPNTNPVILDANGECNLWGTGLYKLVLFDANSVQMFSIDNVPIITGGSANTTFSQWIASGLVPTFISSNSFSVPGDQRSVLQPGMRLQITETAGTVYFTIANVSFASSNTTITVVQDTNPIDSGITSANYGIISVINSSLPIPPVITKTANYTFVPSDVNQVFEFAATPSNFSATVSNANPAIVTAANHGLIVGDQFSFTIGANGILPANTANNTTYFVISAGFTANSFEYATSANGTPINTTGNASNSVFISKNLIATLPAANTFPSNGSISIRDNSVGFVTLSGNFSGYANNPIVYANSFATVYSDNANWYFQRINSTVPEPGAIPVSDANSTVNAWVTQGSLIYDSSNANTNVTYPASNVTASNLNGVLHGGYEIIATFVNSNANAAQTYRMFINNDVTDANYAIQIISGSGAAAGGASGNLAILNSATVANGGEVTFFIRMDISPNGFAKWVSEHIRTDNGSEMAVHKHTASVANITSITWNSNGVNGISPGSRFRIWRKI